MSRFVKDLRGPEIMANRILMKKFEPFRSREWLNQIETFLKKEFKKPSRKRLLNFIEDLRAVGSEFNLPRLGRIYRSDKSLGHSYTKHYQNHLRRFKFKKTTLLEIGVGGYSDPHWGGSSLRMWKKYFPFGKIFSVDIYDKSFLEEQRIKIFKGSQTDFNFLDQVTQEIGDIHIIIDDGSHVNDHVIGTFKYLFPKLKEGGIYIVEDTQTSYWEQYGGDSNLNNPNTIMNFFKGLTDSLNYKEFLDPEYKPSYFDRNIISIHFFHNLIIINKGLNSD